MVIVSTPAVMAPSPLPASSAARVAVSSSLVEVGVCWEQLGKVFLSEKQEMGLSVTQNIFMNRVGLQM